MKKYNSLITKHRLLLIGSRLLLVSFLLYSACSHPLVIEDLPRSASPEVENVSSEGILRYLDAVEESGQELHSLMMVRNGKVVAEGWWKPYSASQNHALYSVSKSFTSTAIGFAVAENLLTVNDKVISFFSGDLPEVVSPHLAALTVKDLLTMSVGHEKELNIFDIPEESSWVKTFLAHPVVYQPGTEYMYNTP